MIRFLLLFLFLVSTPSFAGEIKKEVKAQPEQKTPDWEVMLNTRLDEVGLIIESSPEKAIAELDDIVRKAIEQDLQYLIPQAYTYMAGAYGTLKQPQLGLHFLELAERRYGSKMIKGGGGEFAPPADYYLYKGQIQTQLQQFDSANENFLRFKKMVKDPLEKNYASQLIAENYYNLKSYDRAIEIFESLLKSTPNTQKDDLYAWLAACYISKGDAEQGMVLYKLSVEGEQASPTEINSLNTKKELVTSALRSQQKYQEEVDIRNQALTIIDNGLEHLKLAQTYYQAGELGKSEQSLDAYFNDINYDVLDMAEIAVIQSMSDVLQGENKSEKAFNYLKRYHELSDTIQTRLNWLASRRRQIGTTASKSLLELEILQKNKEMSDNTIDHLMRESQLQNDIVGFQKTMIYLLTGVVILAIIALVFIVRISKQRRRANQQLALRSLRSQMNPHFIFNALNSVNSFISLSDERSANRFLTEFSTLMRTVMENSEHDFISLAKELEILRIYLELEHFRFNDQFSYELVVDENIDDELLQLPPMLIQPYIENAIWHGLRYKKQQGKLWVEIRQDGPLLKVRIQDDGVGRQQSAALKTKNQKKTKSTALKNIQQRVELIKSLHGLEIKVNVSDLNNDGTGTVVSLIIPQPNHA